MTPNPFNPLATITFELPAGGPAEILLFDASGRRLWSKAWPWLQAGSHSVIWDSGDGVIESRLASGLYLLSLRTPAGTVTQKVTLLK